ncbi:hypothetical protein Dimus_027923 [Dionaea muscipula]
MWCDVAFFRGLDEHSTATIPPPTFLGAALAPPQTPPYADEIEIGRVIVLKPNTADADIFVSSLPLPPSFSSGSGATLSVSVHLHPDENERKRKKIKGLWPTATALKRNGL